MLDTIFYSWQSDLPNATNRGFIERALEGAARALREDAALESAPRIDRDIAGVPGAPNITAAIFAKIDAAQVFVCDVSPVSTDTAGRPTPNPNVLIELGYAIKALGWERIIIILNTAFGRPEALPFDIRQHGAITYAMPLASTERAGERARLQGKLTGALRTIFDGPVAQARRESATLPPAAMSAVAAITSAAPNQILAVRAFMAEALAALAALAPDPEAPIPDDALMAAVGQTENLTIAFAEVVEAIAGTDATEAARALYRSFGAVIVRYRPPVGFSGSYRISDGDLWRFIGHEWLVIFVALLLRDERWALLGELLAETFAIENDPSGRVAAANYSSLCQPVELLETRNRRTSANRTSYQGMVLRDRHDAGRLAELVTTRQLVEADILLFLCCRDENARDTWVPRLAVYLGQTPGYLVRATSAVYARRLFQVFGIETIAALRARVRERAGVLPRWFGRHPVFNLADRFDFDPDSLGSRP